MALCFWPISAEPALLILNGLMVGIYGGGFGLAHPGTRGAACITVSWVLGLSHPLWLLAILLVVEPFRVAAVRVFGAAPGDSVMFVGTGLVFAFALALAVRSGRVAVPIVGGTVLAAWSWSHGVASGGPCSPIGCACAALHAGIAAGLAYSAWTALRRDWPPHLCQHCQYDLRGLSRAVCPECGGGIAPPQ